MIQPRILGHVDAGEFIGRDAELRQIVRHAAAIEKLTYWDDFFTKKKCLSWWFETRVRLIATNMLAGNNDRADALAKQLKQAALSATRHMNVLLFGATGMLGQGVLRECL